MAEMNDSYSTKGRMKTAKSVSWSSWTIPEGMSESEALVRRERTRRSNRHMKMHDLEQLNRLPFDEMFLFGSHPESDVLSISQCSGCSRRYITQWLHNYHWEVNSSGDYVCSLTKAVIIPHRTSSKSDHHGHHHRDSSKTLDAVHHHNTPSHPHSKNNNLNSSTKIHHHSSSSSVKSSSSSSLLTSSSKNESSKSSKSGKSSSSSSSSSKPPLMTKAKAKMFPSATSLLSQSHSSSSSSLSSSKSGNQSSSSSSHSKGRLSSSASAAATGGSGSYTLSIPSEDTGQNESVESLLQSNKSYSNGSSYGSKPIQIIATAVQKTSGKSGSLVEGEYEQMKFYSDSYSEKKSKSSSGHSSHGHGHGHSHSSSNHGHGHSHSSHSHGHNHGHSKGGSGSSSNENERILDGGGVLSPTGVSSSHHKSSKSSSSSNSSILQAVTTNPSLQNFKIPLKSKSSSSSSGGGSTPTSGHSQLSPSSISTSSSGVSKSKSKLSPKASLSSHYDSHRSSLSSSFSGLSGSGSSSLASSSSSSHHHSHSSSSSGSSHHHNSGLPHSSGSSSTHGTGSLGTSPASYKSPGPSYSVESPVKVEMKNDDLSPPPPKKKKKKKSKNEPRKVLPLKDRLFDPDQHCGVTNSDSGIPCTRSLTCKTHSMALRRAVPGRSLGFDQLLADHKKARDAEKAAKVALEQQLQIEMSPPSTFSHSSITPNSSSSGGMKTSSSKSKLKSLDGNSGSVPSPVAASSLSNSNSSRNVPNNSSAQSSSSKNQQPFSYSQHAVTSPVVNPSIPKLEIISESPSSLRLSTASPSYPSLTGSPKDPKGSMYESDDFQTRSPGIGYKGPSSSKFGPSSNSSSNHFKIDQSSSLMSPVDLGGFESSSSNYSANSSSLKTSGYTEGPVEMETETIVDVIPQVATVEDTITTAIAMSSMSTDMTSDETPLDIESLLSDSSPSFSTFETHQNQGIGVSPITAATPYTFSAPETSNSYSNSLLLQQQAQNHFLGTNAPFPNYPVGSTPTGYNSGIGFHSTLDGDVLASSGVYHHQLPYQHVDNYSYSSYTQPQSNVLQMYSADETIPRYQAPTGHQFSTEMYQTGIPSYAGALSSVYPTVPLNSHYSASSSTPYLSSTESQQGFLDSYFSHNASSAIPPTGNSNFQSGTNTGSSGRNFLRSRKPFPSDSSADATGLLLRSPGSSLSLNSSGAAGLHRNLMSESGIDLNSLLLDVGMNNGDIGSSSMSMDGNSQKDLKKNCGFQKKTKNIENNSEDYFIFQDLNNTEQAFVTIARLKEPIVITRLLKKGDDETELKKSENENSNLKEGSELNLEESEGNFKTHLLKRNKLKRKMWCDLDEYVPYETQNQSTVGRNSDKGPLKKKIKLKKVKGEGKLTVIPCAREPDPFLKTALGNKPPDAEAAKAIQMTVKSLGNYRGSQAGKRRRNLERKYEELAEERGGEEGGHKRQSRKQNFETKLGDWINDPNDFNTDVFSGMLVRPKDILRHITNNTNIMNNDDSSSKHNTIHINNNNCNNNSSSLNFEKRQGQEKRPIIQARDDVPAPDSQQSPPQPHPNPTRDPPELPAVHNEIESFIDTIPSIDVEETHNNTCRQL